MASLCYHIILLLICVGFEDGLGLTGKKQVSSLIEVEIDIWLTKDLLLDNIWQFHNEIGMDNDNITKVDRVFRK